MNLNELYTSIDGDNKELKLIYIHHVGANSAGRNTYEFIFSKNPQNILSDEWGWDDFPAVDCAQPPDKEYIDEVCVMKTVNKDFSLYCLSQSDDRPYIHAYHGIHCIAYENYGDQDGYSYTDPWDTDDDEDDVDETILIFHYGMTKSDVEKELLIKDMILKPQH